MFDILRYEPAGTFVPKRACARFTAAAACPSLEEILAALLDDAVSRGVIDGGIASRDLLDTRLMGVVTPRPSDVVREFRERLRVSPEKAVESFVEDDGLHVTVHLAVFYGYPFTKLAEEVRREVARAVTEQIGVGVTAVDVCIDSLVFPKE